MTLYSHSRLSTYQQCPFKYKLKYIERIKPSIEETIETFLGSIVHDTLEWLYKEIEMKNIPTLKETLNYYRSEWRENFNNKIRIVKDFSPENYFNKGKEFIKNYYNCYKPFKENTIGIEKRVLVNLDKKGNYKLQGYIDRLVYNEEEGEYEIHDYKTNSELKTRGELDQDRQLALYSIAVKEMYPDADRVCLVWHFLNFDKEFCSYRTDEELEELKKETLDLIKQILAHKKSDKKWEARESSLCRWCGYRDKCPKFKHLHKIKEAKNKNEFLEEPGSKLVKKYSKLKEERKEHKQKEKEVKKEMDKVGEALVKYAKENELETVFGEENKARVKIKDKFKIPPKNSGERKELNKLLKDLDKWDQISTIDRYGLNKIIRDKEWSEDTLNEVKNSPIKKKALGFI